MPLSDEQWTCRCGTANSFVRKNCRDCREAKPSEARIEPTGIGLWRSEGAMYCEWHADLLMLMVMAKASGMSEKSARELEDRLSAMRAKAQAFDEIAGIHEREVKYASHEPGRKFQHDTFGMLAARVVVRNGRRDKSPPQARKLTHGPC